MWLARHTPENTEPIIEKVLEAVKETYADKGYAASLGTYVVGYCFGGKYALRLAGPQGKKYGVNAAAVAHATLITKEDFEGVEKPVIFACAGKLHPKAPGNVRAPIYIYGATENDPYFPDDIREEGRKILEGKQADFQMEIFKGVPHGKLSLCL